MLEFKPSLKTSRTQSQLHSKSPIAQKTGSKPQSASEEWRILSRQHAVNSFDRIAEKQPGTFRLSSDCCEDRAIERQVQINRLYQELHSLNLGVSELRWMLDESLSLIKEYSSLTMSLEMAHSSRIRTITDQLNSLATRVSLIDVSILEQPISLCSISCFDSRQLRQTAPSSRIEYSDKENIACNSLLNLTEKTITPNFTNIQLQETKSTNSHENKNSKLRLLQTENKKIAAEMASLQERYNRARGDVQSLECRLKDAQETNVHHEAKWFSFSTYCQKTMEQVRRILQNSEKLFGIKGVEAKKVVDDISHWQAELAKISCNSLHDLDEERAKVLTEIAQLKWEMHQTAANRNLIPEQTIESPADFYLTQMLHTQAHVIEQLLTM